MYENRIIETGERPADWFLAHPDNWRIHLKVQQDLVSGLLAEVGWVKRVVVNMRTGRLLDGHLRVTLAYRQGEETPVPYDGVDLDEAEEALMLLLLDKSAELAVPDGGQVASVLAQAETDSAAVAAYLDDVRAELATLPLSDADAGGASAGAPTPQATMVSSATAVKVVVLVQDLATVERALQAAKQRNRGDALVAICAAYLADQEEAPHAA